MKNRIVKFLLSIAQKNRLFLNTENPWVLWIWTEIFRIRNRRRAKKETDLQAINRCYYSYTGRYPNLETPTLFSEKLQWIKLNYQDPLMAQCADKFEVRAYVEGLGYGNLLNDLLAVYEAVKEIDLDKLPPRFILKSTHGSSWNILCTEKSEINWRAWKAVLRSWLKYNYYWNAREFVYRTSTPRIVCEKYLEDASGGLMDYKFYCFNGNPGFLQVNVGRGSHQHVQNFYDLKWNIQPFGKDLPPRSTEEIERPGNLDRMIDIAKDLSAPFPFVRVDFYNVDGKIYFGELTFFPNGGKPDFVPSEYDVVIGDMLVLPPALPQQEQGI